MMLSETPEVSREERAIIGRARTSTLVKWFDELNIHSIQPPRAVLKRFGHIIGTGRVEQLMDQILCELGWRYKRGLRKSTGP